MATASVNNRPRILTEPYLSMGILGIVYLVGILGILSPWREWFLILTPLNLLLTITLTLRQEVRLKDLRMLGFCVLAWMTGYWIEVAGVHTGKIFGVYSYGETLGLKIFEVPLMIGVNWLLLVYCCGEAVRRFLKVSRILKALLTALLMTGLDVLIEPVAIRLDFWTWEGETIPLQNFAGWFAVAFFLAFIYHSLPYRKVNQLAVFTLLLQFSFFLILNFTL